ncbi:hypothetical protein H0H92_015243, partial [Tricholoma furcatifolium]
MQNSSTATPSTSSASTSISGLSADRAVSASSTSTPAATIVNPTHEKRNAGPIVGGVLGGLAAVCIAMSLLYYRKRQKTRLELDRLKSSKNMKTHGSPTPSIKDAKPLPKVVADSIPSGSEEWFTVIDAAMHEAAVQTERARSRADSRAHASNYSYDGGSFKGWQSPEAMDATRTYYRPPSSRGMSPVSHSLPFLQSSHEQGTTDGGGNVKRSLLAPESKMEGGRANADGQAWIEELEVYDASTET